MNRTVLQVPITSELRQKAEKEAFSQGFSSLQDAVRFLLNKLAKGILSFEVEETIKLSPKAIRRYEKISKDFEKGKNIYTTKNIDDLMKQLHERSLP